MTVVVTCLTGSKSFGRVKKRDLEQVCYLILKKIKSLYYKPALCTHSTAVEPGLIEGAIISTALPRLYLGFDTTDVRTRGTVSLVFPRTPGHTITSEGVMVARVSGILAEKIIVIRCKKSNSPITLRLKYHSRFAVQINALEALYKI